MMVLFSIDTICPGWPGVNTVINMLYLERMSTEREAIAPEIMQDWAALALRIRPTGIAIAAVTAPLTGQS